MANARVHQMMGQERLVDFTGLVEVSKFSILFLVVNVIGKVFNCCLTYRLSYKFMKKSKFPSIPAYFLRGLLLVVPLALTIYIMVISIRWLDGLIELNFPGLGLLIILGSITVFGYLGSSFLIQPILNFFESIMIRVPLVRIIYTSLKDLVSAFVGDQKKFQQPVLVDLIPDGTIKRVGFITQQDLTTLGAPGFAAVYFPHSYNFSGNLMLLPKEQMKPLKLSGTEAMKFIVSGGVSDIALPKN